MLDTAVDESVSPQHVSLATEAAVDNAVGNTLENDLGIAVLAGGGGGDDDEHDEDEDDEGISSPTHAAVDG